MTGSPSGTMDEHWVPISESCSVCSGDIKYDFVIKYEELEVEERYLVKRLGLESLIMPRWENKQSPENVTTSQVESRVERSYHFTTCR